MLRPYTIGSGRVNNMMSVTILATTIVTYNVGRLKHDPSTASMTVYALRIGLHANNREKVMTGAYMAMIPMVAHKATLNQRWGDRRK